MERYSITMHFILYLGKNFEEFALDVECYSLLREAEEEFVCAVAVVFCKSCNRNTEVEFVFNNFSYNLHLTLSTVGNDEIG